MIFYALSPVQQQRDRKREEYYEPIEEIVKEAVYEPQREEGVTVDLPLYSLFISQKGGIRSCRLKEYKVRKAGIKQLEQQLKSLIANAMGRGGKDTTHLLYSIKKLRYTLEYLRSYRGQKGLELISFSQLYHQSLPPFIEFRDEGNNPVWKEQGTYEISQETPYKLSLSRKILGDIKLTKYYRFDPDSYLIQLKVILENIGEKIHPPRDMLIICGPDIGIDEGLRAYTYQGPMMLIDGKLRREQPSRKVERKTVENIEYGKVSWVALQDKYFAEVLIPYDSVRRAYLKKNEMDEFSVGLKVEVPSLKPGEREEFNFGMYFGPKKFESIEKIGGDLVKIVDYGFFGNLFRLIYILKFFYRLTHNYGLAIICLTVLINMILFPLSFKSFKSMKEMRKLQPEMERIRRQFKDDPQKMNREVMELYRRHKVNPAGGCLPMIFQMPIFIGLFMTLRSATELRGAHFVGWISDLSLPDTLLYLPFSIPFLGSSLNILPLIMTGVTFLQQKISGGGGSSKMMLFFPLFLLFIFYNFPSGLVLYFLCSNGINMLEQLWIGRMGTKKV